MAGVTIQTPRGQIITSKDKNGKVTARLVWDSGFSSRWSKKTNYAQKYIDSEVLRRCDRYVPMKTGMLKKSGILGTVIGSGTVQYIAPYARKQYLYGKMKRRSNSRRGRLWFMRMKLAEKEEIQKGIGDKFQ